MDIDRHSIRPGGRISVTLDDGLQVINAEVHGEEGSIPWIRLPSLPIYYTNGDPNKAIVSVDAYTPPPPGWDRPEVYAIRSHNGDTYARRRDGSWSFPDPVVWERAYGPCTVLAVYSEGG